MWVVTVPVLVFDIVTADVAIAVEDRPAPLLVIFLLIQLQNLPNSNSTSATWPIRLANVMSIDFVRWFTTKRSLLLRSLWSRNGSPLGRLVHFSVVWSVLNERHGNCQTNRKLEANALITIGESDSFDNDNTLDHLFTLKHNRQFR